MKLIIQIPCFNEENTLSLTLKNIPKKIDGTNKIEIQIIDDGSTDKTLNIAKQYKVDHIVVFKKRQGLAAAFKAGVDNALQNGADIVVNTDADNQYSGQDIGKLVEPIINGKAEIVIGCRPINKHQEFSFIKKCLQKFGSFVLRKLSNTNVKDATSGFRAYSRESLLHLNIYSRFSYTIETLIQAGYNNLKVDSVDIHVNPKTRESRLFNNIFEFIWKQFKTILIIFFVYKSNIFFNTISFISFLLSFILIMRYIILVKFYNAPSNLFWPSIIFSAILTVMSLIFYITGVLATLIATSRKLNEEILYRMRKTETLNYDKNKLI
jgi:glycosyltransferase involved in cell wall biosynthesis